MGLPALARGQWSDRVPRLPSERGEDLSAAARTDAWVGATFPKSRCCGVEIKSLQDFEAHATSWRHYENTKFPGLWAGADAPTIAEYIDPRKVDGEAAFAALPKYEAYARMKRYVGNYKHELKCLDDEASPPRS